MRLALGIEYDGAPYCGWQSQPSGCSVQDHLEKALQTMAGHPLRVVAAGRTDTGVHAMIQVIHFDTETVRPTNAWVRGINSMLPAAIRVLWALPVERDFHARFSAFERSYQYVLMNSPIAPGIMNGKAGWFHASLDVEMMQRGSRYLLGEHDFSAFRAAECQAKSPVRHMHEASVHVHGSAIIFEFRANAFLHHQVRNMVGALVYIGKGNYPAEYMAELLLSRDRTKAPPTFSPSGLYLTGIGYEVKWGLPETRRRVSFVS